MVPASSALTISTSTLAKQRGGKRAGRRGVEDDACAALLRAGSDDAAQRPSGLRAAAMSVVPAASAASGTSAGSAAALAPATMVMAFWPAASTWISAMPVGPATLRTQRRSTFASSRAGERRRREHVGADGARHRDACARPAGGERLVGALAARQRANDFAGDRLTRPREARDPRDQVEIDRAEDDDHRDPGRESVLRIGA